MFKKGFTIILLIILFTLVGCGLTSQTTETTETTSSTSSPTTTNSETTTTTNTTATTTIVETGLSQAVVDSFADESVTLELSYRLGTEQSAALELMITAFETEYPQVDIISTRESSDRTVATNILSGILGGQGADLILLDQVYLSSILANSLEPLDDYINSSSNLSGVDVGVEMTTIEENIFTNIIGINSTISFPFTRLAQVMFANRDALATNAQALSTAEVNVNSEGFISRNSQLSLTSLETISRVITDKTILTIERPNLMFETLLGQINVSIITDNEYSFNQAGTIDLMNNLRTFSNDNVLALAMNFEQEYTSSIFLDGDTLFAVSDSSSLSYMISGLDFNIDILPLAKAENSGSIFFGSDFGINSNSTDVEKFYAWMFIRFVTNLSSEYLNFCFDYGYAPIYKLSTFFLATDYTEMMTVLQEYATANGNPSWPLEDERWNQVYLSMIQSVYMIYRSNIIERQFIPTINSTGVENKISYIDDYIEDIFYETGDIGNLTTSLIDDLNNY